MSIQSRFLCFILLFWSYESEAQDSYQAYSLQVDTITDNIGVLVGALGVTDLTGYRCSRVLLSTPNPDDFVSRVYGNALTPTYVQTSTHFYHALLGGGVPNGINSLLFPVYPDLAYDSWVTIGLDGYPDSGAGEENVEVQIPDSWFASFDPGGGIPGSSFALDGTIDRGWSTASGATNGYAGEELTVLLAQLTTTGMLLGQLQVEVYVHGDSTDVLQLTFGLNQLLTGCSEPEACNYMGSVFIEDGSCMMAPPGGSCCSSGLFISEFTEGVGHNTFLELYNASPDTVLLDDFLVARTANQLNPAGGFDFFDIEFPAETRLPPQETYVIAEEGADGDILGTADLLVSEISSGDDAIALINPEGVVVDQIGIPGEDEGFGWTVDGVEDATYNNSIRRASWVHDGNGGDWMASNGQMEASEWLVVDGADYSGMNQHDCDGSCYGPSEFLLRGCAFEGATNFDSTATASVMAMCRILGCTDEAACNFVPIATLDDGTCDYVCIGCTDPEACNFEDFHTSDDGSCDYSCIGCTDPEACNYAVEFTIEDGSCGYDCYGCMDPFACNFLISYTVDDGSCEFATCLGCTDPDGCNFDAGAIYDDGSCIYGSCSGCADEAACNYGGDFVIFDDGSCEYPLWGFDCDCQCLNDADYDGFCDDFNGVDGCLYIGCMDQEACNFDVSATVDGGCLFLDECGVCGGGGIPAGQCDCEGNVEDALGDCGGDCASDQDADGVCDVDEVIGCQNPFACNYDPEATDPGTCYSPVVVSGVVVVDCSGEFTPQVGDALCGPGTYWDDQWNGCLAYEDCASDVDGDGFVAINDLLNLLADFTTSCE